MWSWKGQLCIGQRRGSFGVWMTCWDGEQLEYHMAVVGTLVFSVGFRWVGWRMRGTRIKREAGKREISYGVAREAKNGVTSF